MSTCFPPLPGTLAARETRYVLRGETDVTVQRRHDRQPRVIQGRLLDLTVSGAKLSIPEPLPVEESLTLLFRFGETGLNFMVEAQVRWSRPGRESLWWLGCSFSPKMDDEYLACLASEGLLDRREEPRRRIQLSAKARWELADSRQYDVRIDDICSGGVRLTAPQGAEPGQRLLLEATGLEGRRLLIPARCQWQIEGDGEFQLGCSFIEATGFARLSEALAADAPLPSSRAPRRPWLWPWGKA